MTSLKYIVIREINSSHDSNPIFNVIQPLQIFLD